MKSLDKQRSNYAAKTLGEEDLKNGYCNLL